MRKSCFQTDSKAAALVTKVMGASADRLAEQAVAQMELFYSALVWYLYQNPDRAKELGVYMHFSERTSQAPLLGKDPG
ncbi:MAG: hypothetical protein KatS3mg105_0305 [Gemmatales bacterium]|nr:MAG: hypothetical protein KatS3mg105_0305 [Gemmatales bacterium]